MTTLSPSANRDQVHALLLTEPSPAVRRLAVVLWAAVIATPPALGLLPWQQNITGAGRVVAFAPLDRQQVIEAPIDGRIIRCHVAEGSEVKAGDRLIELADNDPELIARLRDQREAALAKQRAAEAKIDSYNAQIVALTESRKLALLIAAERLTMAKERSAAAEQSLTGASAAMATAELNHTRQTALMKEGLASRREFELAELSLRQTDAEVKRAQAALAAAKAEVKSWTQDADRVGNDEEAKIRSASANRDSASGDLASARSDLLKIESQIAKQQTQVIVAPRGGTVLRLAAAEGNYLKAGSPLLTLVPEGDDRAVELWVDGNDAPLIEPGRKVRLQFEGWPAVQFAGWPSVAVGTFGGTVSLVDSADDGKGRFRILITPDPADAPWPSNHYLRQGVRTRGWVLLDQVSLGYEIWRQLNGFPPSVEPHKEPEAKKK